MVIKLSCEARFKLQTRNARLILWQDASNEMEVHEKIKFLPHLIELKFETRNARARLIPWQAASNADQHQLK